MWFIYVSITYNLYQPFQAYAIEVCQTEHQALGLSVVIFRATLRTLFANLRVVVLLKIVLYLQVNTAWGVGLVIGPGLGGYLAQVPVYTDIQCLYNHTSQGLGARVCLL